MSFLILLEALDDEADLEILDEAEVVIHFSTIRSKSLKVSFEKNSEVRLFRRPLVIVEETWDRFMTISLADEAVIQ